MSSALSARDGITSLLRRINLAPSVLIIAGVSFLAHVLVGNNYGYFRDELYFMAMSHHPAFGYVDVPPLVPWITLIPRFLTGNALWAIHVISALVCAGTILLTGLMARLLGGAGWVQGLAALGSATALVFMANGSIYAYDVFDVILVDAGRHHPHRAAARRSAAMVARVRRGGWPGLVDEGDDPLLGVRTGRRLAADSTAPPAVHPLDRVWRPDRLCALLAVPALECCQWLGVVAVLGELFRQSWRCWDRPLDFLANQILGHESPLGALVGSGLWYYFSKRGARYRVFGWAYLILFVLFIAIQGKTYFLAPAYPPLFAGGAMVVGRWRVRWPRWGPEGSRPMPSC